VTLVAAEEEAEEEEEAAAPASAAAPPRKAELDALVGERVARLVKGVGPVFGTIQSASLSFPTTFIIDGEIAEFEVSACVLSMAAGFQLRDARRSPTNHSRRCCRWKCSTTPTPPWT
jgi:hypothetical protein